MPRRCPQLIRPSACAQPQPVFCTRDETTGVKRRLHQGAGPRGRCDRIETAGLHLFAILLQRPVQIERAQVGDVVFIAQAEQSTLYIHCLHGDVLIDLFDLPQLGSWRTIGKQQPAKSEIGVGRMFRRFIIAGIGIVHPAVLIFFQQSLVRPVPDAAADQGRIGLDRLPVFLQIAAGISIAQRIFAEKKRFVIFLFAVLNDALNRGVHPAVDVAGLIIALIVNQPGRIHAMGVITHD